ncbi:MAG: hypothetical protein AABW90_02060 [Nanoarchaeota archaeon]
MALDKDIIESLDHEIIDIVTRLNELPFCNTLYSCGGHPETDKAATPYITMKYNSRDISRASSLHRSLLKKVPYIYFRVLPQEYSNIDFEELIGKEDHSLTYLMDYEHTRENTNEFWEGWKKVLNDYDSKPF